MAFNWVGLHSDFSALTDMLEISLGADKNYSFDHDLKIVFGLVGSYMLSYFFYF